MKKLSILIICALLVSCSRTLTSLEYNATNASKGIYYNLPKSIIKMEIEYTLYRDYNLVNGKKIYQGDTYAKIESPITVSSIPIPDESKRFILTYKKNNSNYFFEDNYTVELTKKGGLKSLNWETENVIPDIASNIISSGLNVFKAISPASDESVADKYFDLIAKYEKGALALEHQILDESLKGNIKKAKELKDLHALVVSQLDKLKSLNKKGLKDKKTKTETVFINLEKDYSNNVLITKSTAGYVIDLTSKFKGIDEDSFPKITFSIASVDISSDDKEGLKYRIPKSVDYKLTLNDPSDSDRILIEGDISILQYGPVNSFPLNVKGSKKSKLALTIDENTGLITKVSNTSNSILKDASSKLKSTTEEIYKTFDNYAFNKKKKELENEKALLELNNSIEELNKEDEPPKEPSDLEKQIAELKLLLQKLELELKIKELEDSEEGEE